LPIACYLLHAKGSDFDPRFEGFGAVVGVAVIQNFIITFDFHDGVIVLERPSSDRDASDSLKALITTV
jgi:hypothetical protein